MAQESESVKSKRIAKNSAYLYVGLMARMLINFYASRVILASLGIDDYGVYNVVGGFVLMFGVLSNSLSSACSRFLNYEMGNAGRDRLSKIFSLSVTIMFAIAVIVAVVCEIVGVWYIRNVLVVADSRRIAAAWVFQISLLTFCWNLITVPYSSAIIAHERMKVFTCVNIYEGVAKLIICYLVVLSPIDRLIFYAIMVCVLQMSVRLIYKSYSKHRFEECTYRFYYDKSMFRQMLSYAGWTFIGQSANLLRNQGGNILINQFFGPAVNAAKAVANQVLHAVDEFAVNFMRAVNPQITQSYASGQYGYMVKLVYLGSRYSYYVMLLLSLPFIVRADFILDLWLEEVPAHSVLFLRLSLLLSMTGAISKPLITAIGATGIVRNYQIAVGIICILCLPICYFIYKCGGIAESFMVVSLVAEFGCLVTRLVVLHRNMHFNIWKYVMKVLMRLLVVTAVASVVPVILVCCLHDSTFAACLEIAVSVLSVISAIVLVGLDSDERIMLRSVAVRAVHGLLNRKK